MPIFVFECPTCKRTHETVQKWDDPAPFCVLCCDDGVARPMVKQISQTAPPQFTVRDTYKSRKPK